MESVLASLTDFCYIPPTLIIWHSSCIYCFHCSEAARTSRLRTGISWSQLFPAQYTHTHNNNTHTVTIYKLNKN